MAPKASSQYGWDGAYMCHMEYDQTAEYARWVRLHLRRVGKSGGSPIGTIRALKANIALDGNMFRAWWLRMGGDQQEPRTFRAVGEILGLSRERIRQLCCKFRKWILWETDFIPPHNMERMVDKWWKRLPETHPPLTKEGLAAWQTHR